MELITRVDLPAPPFTFAYSDRLLLLGSCFAEHIGLKLHRYKFPVDTNPFGTLYNPCSIASAVEILKSDKLYTPADLFRHNGQFHSFDHHSRFSSFSEADCLEAINRRLAESREKLPVTRVTIVTLGTAFVYRLKESGRIAANCHKLPEKQFRRYRLGVAEITESLRTVCRALWEIQPGMCFIFTVSPIRHWRDGAHENQLSKASLLLAVDALVKEYPASVAYFPAYELMMDELRDYRFYADDMVHPSALAVEYIWERFVSGYVAPPSLEAMKEWDKIARALEHRPFDERGEAYQKFIVQTLLKMERITQKFPSFDIRNEIDMLKSKLN
ncbi:MAG: GSCFA domain-containing protein [Parabacteroides sp.]|nr:GSCFA domain-containing protein [Parabacteroides sp.]